MNKFDFNVYCLINKRNYNVLFVMWYLATLRDILKIGT